MYRLTLTATERQAFDWVGDRYYTGDAWYRLLWLECTLEDAEWDSDQDITFAIPENIAWQLKELAEKEKYLWPCFSDELARKLQDFCNSIV
jgi:hypothetical protein